MVYVSPQVEAILGYTPEQWQDPGFWMRVMHPDDVERVVALSTDTNASGEAYRQDYRLLSADGRVVWFHDESTAVRDAEGRVVSWQGVLIDITERKLAEEQLREAEETFRTIVERNPAIIYTQEVDPVDGISRTTYISPRQPEVFGYTPRRWSATRRCGCGRSTPRTAIGSCRRTPRATSSSATRSSSSTA